MAWPGAPASASCLRRCARAENTDVRSGNRIRGIARPAEASIWPGSRMRGMSDLAEPGPMMLPGPARCHGASEHGMDRALHPDRGVNVDQDRADQHERAHRVQQRGEANQSDYEVGGEIRAPDDEPRQQQSRQAGDDHEEQELLAGVVATDLAARLLATL